MSNLAEVPNIEEQAPVDLLQSLKSFLGTLVPPTQVVIQDVFGNSYELNCSISARNQIKILREFDKIKSLDSSISWSGGDGTIGGMIDNIVNIATDEQALLIVCRCFSLGHGAALIQAKEHADANNVEYEKSDFACADLFALEELVTAIVPLFIRLAKRASQALNSVLSN